ncbi:16S rRNA (cytosine967-C5)-methyltransferase [Mobilisporobacter senegalensis]|uniref:16S rRNA (cytosine(967)-C(5))-methyltransferase n=1 Tax=Mobilisporobacter senegalensis TaxID=1329262 RepID=A0A3N1XVR9_9FIRM|nr:16S rRNA (cytosine(967)-C(5))-methyltransferase RsmB [Mobilisporobacter senegalensis]ROR30725.1 16S rRNA (cytosine967-C5)-methyltransferase [Mobilisporobacter senegalensis]
MTKAAPIRELVLGILIDVAENNEYSHQVINNTLKKYQYLEKQDRAFLTRLSEGTIERLLHLDYVLDQFSKVKVGKMKPVIRNILRMGVYQILFMDSVPVSAACNEAVKLAEKKGFYNLKGFVNGILRNISRNKDNIKYPDETKEPVKYLSVLYSTPGWIINNWLNDYDYEAVKKMLRDSMREREVSIRCNLTKTEPLKLKEILLDNGITVTDSPYLPYAYRISGINYMNDIPAFEQGFFQIQDESSMFVAEVAGIEKGNTIIDVCAAPGGKSLHAADKLQSTGIIMARDLTEYKVSLIEDNIHRLAYSNVKAEIVDALAYDKDSLEKADIVFADLPCSGLGVFGKKADIKYKMTPEKQKDLVKLQRDILDIVWQYVKKGGILIYSTCTVNKDENINNVKWFMDKYNFSLESIDEYLPESLRCNTTKEGYLQFLPGIHDTDGFFLAKLRKDK